MTEPLADHAGALYAPIPSPGQTFNGLNRTRIYDLAAKQKIRLVKVGRQSLIDTRSVFAYLNSLPASPIGGNAEQRAA